MSQEETCRLGEDLFAEHLGGHSLMSNARHLRGSAWLNFPRVLCGNWRDGKVVLSLVDDFRHGSHAVWGISARNREQNFALNALMGLPSVVVGVLVYLALSRSGRFGGYGLLFSPAAMVVAQSVLVVPLIAAVSRQIVEDAWKEYAPEFSLIGIGRPQAVMLLLADCRFSLSVATLAGLGRAMSEVGAVMIVGGNIDGFTRVMTTAIALETSKGDLPLALALGLILLAVVLVPHVGKGVNGAKRWIPMGFMSFQPSDMSWSYRNRGSVQRTQMKKMMKPTTFARKQPMCSRPSQKGVAPALKSR